MNLSIPILVILFTLYPLIYVHTFPETFFIRWVILLMAGLIAAYIMIRNKLLRKNKCIIPLALFISFVFISTVFSHYPYEAWVGISYRFTGFLSYLCFAVLFLLAFSVAFREPEKVNKIIDLWLLSASIIASIGLLQYFGINLIPDGTGVFVVNKSYSTFSHSNHFGTFILMVFPFAALRFLQKPGIRSTLILILIYGSLLTSLCRGAFIGMAFGFIILVRYYPVKKYLLSAAVIMFLVTAALMPANNWMLLKQIATAQSELDMAVAGDPKTGSFRLLVWQEALKALPGSIVIGTGPDTFLYISQEKFEEVQGKGWPGKAHNIYLEIWVTMGLLSLLSYLWFLKSCASDTNRGIPIEFAFFLMVVIYLIQGFFLVDVLSVYPLFWMLLGFYAGLTNRRIDTDIATS
ncbi:O-antigen ligase family protein [Pelotomaculum propionicicum]|uniref:O-antigen ligase family protein n=1 Tax=Pelotomaculum propionicicum TaxID=258475 RepID=UPI003B7EFAE9